MINHLMLELFIAKDWDIKTTTNGKTIARSSAKLDGGFYDKAKGEWVKKDGGWINLEFWFNNEKQLKGSHKGSHVLLTGQLAFNPWTTKEGVARVDTIFKVNELLIIQKPEKSAAHEPEDAGYVGQDTTYDEDIPY